MILRRISSIAHIVKNWVDGLIVRRPFLGRVLASPTAAGTVALMAALREPVARS